MKKTFGNTVRDYVGGIEYGNGSIEFIQTEEGRALPGTNYTYEYMLKDHLGNTRATINGNGEIVQVQDYYAFGMEMNPGNTKNPSPPNQYKYNGKEKQAELGLDQLDYGARFYDPVIGRWNVVDPMAENYINASPYNYVLNNPINSIDPDGMRVEEGPHHIASTFVDGSGRVIKHVNDGDPSIYIVPNQSKWDGSKDGLKIFGYEKPGVNYNEMIGQIIQPGQSIMFDPRKYPYDPPFSPDYTVESIVIPAGILGKLYKAFSFLRNLSTGSIVRIGDKIQKQMGRRGWDEKSIERTVERPHAISQATNRANSSTAYFNRDGSYVVKDNKTGDIIQVSNRNDPNWVPDNTIVNPFIPKR